MQGMDSIHFITIYCIIGCPLFTTLYAYHYQVSLLLKGEFELQCLCEFNLLVRVGQHYFQQGKGSMHFIIMFSAV